MQLAGFASDASQPPNWFVDESLADDRCTAWVAKRHGPFGVAVRGHQHPSDDAAEGSGAIRMPRVSFLNDVAVCEGRQWGSQLLRAHAHELPSRSGGKHRSHAEAPPHDHHRAHWDPPCTAVLGCTPQQVDKPDTWLVHPSKSEGVRVAVTSVCGVPCVQVASTHLLPEAPPVRPPTACRFPSEELPTLDGYICPTTLEDDSIRYLVTSVPNLTRCSATPITSKEDGAPLACSTVAAPRWKCKGTASLSRRCAFLHAQCWPSPTSLSPYDPLSWVSTASVYLHTLIHRSELHGPLAGSQTASPSRRLLHETCGLATEVHPAVDPRWTFSASVQHVTPFSPSGVISRSPYSDRLPWRVGVAYDSAVQRSTSGGGLLQWRGEWGAQVAGGEDEHTPVSFKESNGMWFRWTIEQLFRGRRDRSAVPLDVVLRARLLGALQLHRTAGGNRYPPLLLPPSLFPRGLALGGSASVPQSEISSLPTCSWTAQFGFMAASLEAQFVRAFGTGADATLFANALISTDASPTWFSPQHHPGRAAVPQQDSLALLWSAGCSLKTSGGAMQTPRFLTEWNQFIPQRVECSAPLFTSATRCRVGGAVGDGGSGGSAAWASWMPKCGVVWHV